MSFEALRARLASNIEASFGPFDPLLLEALRVVPRERFVRATDRVHSAADTPLALDDSGLATISAPHAYMLSYRLLALGPGDRLVELGTGSGYGAALASFVVGARGHVTTVEIDPQLAAIARSLLAPLTNVVNVHGDAMSSTPMWRDARKVVCTFAIDDVPHSWLEALPEGGVLVAPVSTRDVRAPNQALVRVEKTGDMIRTSEHGAMRYVKNRSPQTM